MSDVPEVLCSSAYIRRVGRRWPAALLDHPAHGGCGSTRQASAPTAEINAVVRAAMNETGIDLSQAFPTKLTTDALEAADVIITVGCGDACPVYPGKRYLDWELPDPAGKGIDGVRPIRDEIDRHVRDLVRQLVPEQA